MPGERVAVLLAAGGARWEVEALRLVSGGMAGAVLLKRCVALPDLLASAARGQARVAVVAADLPGLDADSVGHLRAEGVAVVLVRASDGAAPTADLPGVFAVVGAEEVARLAEAVPAAVTHAAAGETDERGAPAARQAPARPDASGPDSGAGGTSRPGLGRVLAVWGPTGAPGRTTVAVGVAAELSRRHQDVLLVDADGYGGAVAQHLGVLDEASGLLSAVRLANSGRLDVPRLATVARTVRPGLRVLTGLPRADRWSEVRAVAFDALLDTARRLCDQVVLDLGFSLEQSEAAFGSGAPQRNLMTVAGLDQADEIVVVGSADPVGLARLARGLVELREVAAVPPTRVVVNRMRPSLGWGEKEVRAMVEGFLSPLSMHFLPDDPAAADRALVAGRSLLDSGESALRSALSRVVDALPAHAPGVPGAPRARTRRLRRRSTPQTR